LPLCLVLCRLITTGSWRRSRPDSHGRRRADLFPLRHTRGVHPDPAGRQVHIANLTLDHCATCCTPAWGGSTPACGAQGMRRRGSRHRGERAGESGLCRRRGRAARRLSDQLARHVFTALYAAGGVTERAKLAASRCGAWQDGRDAGPCTTFARGDTRADVRLETGDVVSCRSTSRACTSTRGAATRDLRDQGGRNARGHDQSGGGFRPDAALERVKVERVLPAADAVPDHRACDDRCPMSWRGSGLALEDGDVVQWMRWPMRRTNTL